MEYDPISYPKVKLGDQEYEVCFTAGSVIRLKKEHSLDLNSLDKDLKGAEAIEQTCKLLSAGISKQAKFTVEQIADMIDLADLPLYAQAIGEALKKVSAQIELLNAKGTKQ